ncbi:hypothetical protein [Pseudohaliea rubra]|uniref:hypothetical protein n=1 Tax=Pseudohaliea rubra TaxID=475795 RepID=UPI0005532BED|nr:hypothetical protein [Pseudohaliea rubra]
MSDEALVDVTLSAKTTTVRLPEDEATTLRVLLDRAGEWVMAWELKKHRVQEPDETVARLKEKGARIERKRKPAVAEMCQLIPSERHYRYIGWEVSTFVQPETEGEVDTEWL